MSSKKTVDYTPTLDQIRESKLKCWKRWMIHADPGCFNGWFITDSSDSVAAGW